MVPEQFEQPIGVRRNTIIKPESLGNVPGTPVRTVVIAVVNNH